MDTWEEMEMAIYFQYRDPRPEWVAISKTPEYEEYLLKEYDKQFK